MTDFAQVSDRMLELEVAVARDPRPEVPIIDVISSLLGIEMTPELAEAVQREVRRARELSNNHYARYLDKAADDPALIGGIAFMQGITFARAVRDIEGGPPATDALIHVRRARVAAGEPDTAIPAHRATAVRQNLRFAAELLSRMR